jgi:hypothetical protein
MLEGGEEKSLPPRQQKVYNQVCITPTLLGNFIGASRRKGKGKGWKGTGLGRKDKE